MVSQLSTDGEALRLFFTDDIYFVNETVADAKGDVEPVVAVSVAPVAQPLAQVGQPDSVAQLPTDVAQLPNDVAPTNLPELNTVDFKFLGKNKRNILILVNDEHNEVSNEAGRELLRKIVKSINLTAEDFALLNYARYTGTNFEQLKAYFNSDIVFSFGVPPAALGLADYPENTIVSQGAVRLVFSAELPHLNEDANAKKILWSSLKNLAL